MGRACCGVMVLIVAVLFSGCAAITSETIIRPTITETKVSLCGGLVPLYEHTTRDYGRDWHEAE